MIEYASPAANAVLLLMQILLVGAALQDIRQLKISNVFPLSIMACFIAWAILVGPTIAIWENLVAFILVLFGGLVLFSLKGLGGGDVKLLAALALWFSLSDALRMLIFVVIGGGVVALALVPLRRMVPLPNSGWAAFKTRGPIPYGIAIAAGALIAIHVVGVSPKPLTPMQKFHQMGLFVKKQS